MAFPPIVLAGADTVSARGAMRYRVSSAFKAKHYNDKRMLPGCYLVRERVRKRFEVTKDGYEIQDAGELELH